MKLNECDELLALFEDPYVFGVSPFRTGFLHFGSKRKRDFIKADSSQRHTSGRVALVPELLSDVRWVRDGTLVRTAGGGHAHGEPDDEHNPRLGEAVETVEDQHLRERHC